VSSRDTCRGQPETAGEHEMIKDIADGAPQKGRAGSPALGAVEIYFVDLDHRQAAALRGKRVESTVIAFSFASNFFPAVATRP